MDLPEYALGANELLKDKDERLGVLNPRMENAEVIDAFRDGSDKFIYGQASLEECAEEMINNINAAIENMESGKE